MKNIIINLISRFKSLNFSKKSITFLCLFSILISSFGFVFLSYKGFLTALADDLPFEPSCSNSPTSPAWNPFPIRTNSPSPIFSSAGCEDIPMLSFFPIDTDNNNPRVKNMELGGIESAAIHFYYNPQGPNNTINSPRAGVEIVETADHQYTVKGLLSGSNVADVRSQDKGGDLTINVPEGYRLEVDWDSARWYPNALFRRWISDTRGGSPFDPDPGMPSIITHFDNSREQDYITGPMNISYRDSNGNGVKDADTPDALEGGFLNFGYYLFRLKLVEKEEEEEELIDLQLTKTVNHPTRTVGQEAVFTITVENLTNVDATGVTVFDPLPSGLDYISDDSNGDYDTSTGIWTIGNINGGQSVSLQITVTSQTAETYLNIAEVETADQEDASSTPGNNNGSEDTNENDEDKAEVVFRDLVFEIEKDVNVGNETPVRVGDLLTYTITVTNASEADQTQVITITDLLDSNLDFVSCSNDCQTSQQDGRTLVSWQVNNLQTQQSIDLNLEVRVKENAEDEVINTARIICPESSDTCCPDGCNSNTIVNPIEGNLELEKTADNTNLVPNAIVTYTIRYTNRTARTLTEAIIVDEIPNGLVYIDHSCEPESICQYDSASNTLIWQIGSIPPGASGTVSFKARVSGSATGEIVNTAVIRTAEEPDVRDSAEIQVTRVIIERTTRTGGPRLTAVLGSFVALTTILFVFIKKKRLGFKNLSEERIKEE